MRNWGVGALALLLGACSGTIVPPAVDRAPVNRPSPARVPVYGSAAPSQTLVPVRQPTSATPMTPMPSAPPSAGAVDAVRSGVVAGPAVATLPIAPDQAAAALAAFLTSCPSLERRVDASGLTSGADWQPACDAAAHTAGRDAASFFARWFETVQVGDGRAYATGYFLPEVQASRTRRSGYDVPIYARPSDLVDVDLGQFSAVLAGKRVRGRVQGPSLVSLLRSRRDRSWRAWRQRTDNRLGRRPGGDLFPPDPGIGRACAFPTGRPSVSVTTIRTAATTPASAS